MSLLSADEFIHLYVSDPKKSLEWLEKTEMDLKTLFTRSADFTKLAEAHAQAFAKAQPDAVAELDEPIDSLLAVAGTQIAELYQSFGQLLELNTANQSLAFTIFTYAPEQIISLFKFAEQFMELLQANQALALHIFEHAKTQIDLLSMLPEQFSALEQAHSSIAQDVLKQATNQTTAGSSLHPLQEQQDQPGSAFVSTNNSIDKQSGHTDYSFYLKVLGALTAIIVGAGIFIAALLISQPVVTTVAGIWAGTGIAGLGFFAITEGCMTDENVANDNSNIPRPVCS